jgi:hypothetical protein
MMSQKEWKEFREFTQTCENVKPTRGGSFCLIDGITSYCDPYSCPKWKK